MNILILLAILTLQCHLIEYSDNYSDTSGSSWQFKRDESPINDAGNPVSAATNNSSAFKYKSGILEKPAAVSNNGVSENAKFAVPLKVVPLINYKIQYQLNWTKNCAMSDNDDEDNNDDITFKITNTKLYVSIVPLSTEENVKLTQQLNKGFKRPVFWNEHKTKIEQKHLHNNNIIRLYLDASFQGVKRLFLLAFNNTDNGGKKVERDSRRKYFLPRVNTTNYN